MPTICFPLLLKAGTTTRRRKDSTLSAQSSHHSTPLQYQSSLPTIPASRNVSGASQFPMRMDSTSATEITDRAVLSQPIARAPEGLPYPQLVERQLGPSSAGMKASTSSGSVKALTGGLLSSFGRRKQKLGTAGYVAGSIDMGSSGGVSPGFPTRRGSLPSSPLLLPPPSQHSTRASSPTARPHSVAVPSMSPSLRGTVQQQRQSPVPSPRGPRERSRASMDARRSVELR